MNPDINTLMRLRRPPTPADARAAQLLPQVLDGIERATQRRQRRHEWTLQLAAVIVALGIGWVRGESGSRTILVRAGAHAAPVVVQLPGHEGTP